MQERILAPPRADHVNRYDGQAFAGATKFQSKKFALKSFEGAKEMPTRSFFSRTFGGSKKARTKTSDYGDSTFSTESAAGADTKFSSGGYDTSTFAQSHRSTQLKAGEVPVRSTEVEAQAQGRLDAFSRELDGNLTIDEIRELLNKPR